MKKLTILLLTIILFACSDDSDNNSSSATLLKGTVATGAPQSATVYIKSINGTLKTTKSDSAGNYSIDIGANNGPFIIKVVPDDTTQPEIYSYAAGSGVANGTPFTTLAMFIAKKQDLSDMYDDWQNEAQQWELKDIENAVAIINANFDAQLRTLEVDPTIYDMFTQEFVANSSGFDAFLDNYDVDIDFNNINYQVTDSTGSSINVDESVDISSYYIGATFALDIATNWVVTLNVDINGNSTTFLSEFPINADDIPYSRSRFMEESWAQIADQTTTVNTGVGALTVTVLGYEPTYKIVGDGDIGTRITASASYQYNIKGSVQGQNINENYSYGFSWIYERIN